MKSSFTMSGPNKTNSKAKFPLLATWIRGEDKTISDLPCSTVVLFLSPTTGIRIPQDGNPFSSVEPVEEWVNIVDENWVLLPTGASVTFIQE